MASFWLSLQFNKQICKKQALVIGFVSFEGFSLWLVYSSIYTTSRSNAKVECKLLKLIIKLSLTFAHKASFVGLIGCPRKVILNCGA
jgi:hypothetical protein